MNSEVNVCQKERDEIISKLSELSLQDGLFSVYYFNEITYYSKLDGYKRSRLEYEKCFPEASKKEITELCSDCFGLFRLAERHYYDSKRQGSAILDKLRMVVEMKFPQFGKYTYEKLFIHMESKARVFEEEYEKLVNETNYLSTADAIFHFHFDNFKKLFSSNNMSQHQRLPQVDYQKFFSDLPEEQIKELVIQCESIIKLDSKFTQKLLDEDEASVESALSEMKLEFPMFTEVTFQKLIPHWQANATKCKMEYSKVTSIIKNKSIPDAVFHIYYYNERSRQSTCSPIDYKSIFPQLSKEEIAELISDVEGVLSLAYALGNASLWLEDSAFQKLYEEMKLKYPMFSEGTYRQVVGRGEFEAR